MSCCAMLRLRLSTTSCSQVLSQSHISDVSLSAIACCTAMEELALHCCPKISNEVRRGESSRAL